ncbi:PREDICTED: uncharacterized protein LOC108566152 [Nicrophorus vespilloides]|uniref:Uncharacterized protein LOC108566152 n=1 Tax=Nicrophorus vespilloides TaxID=110193 RepID=A0ABM1N3J0_NICVS|nr:PREDICTED: uncharacterized protein LOC108566152 [Nicrophorus vespilloides]XP_017781391.1 PREDICTED: uncharacterized protein LOC108566152 [Nicrophorus vespilloides]XP_017781392.1 PREDICTED: uncharacterized protein LOC108566152 [Nicrophorus vespilloides]XP_017781393.1 PREDICTED: uncharacterized protein LOC108566152 [Nicrophorus vespilloides]
MAKRRRNRRNRKRAHNDSRQNDSSYHAETLQQEFAPQVPNNSIISTPLNTHKTPVVVTPIKNTETTPRVLRSNSLVLRKKINIDTARTRSNSFVTPKNRNLAKIRNDNLNCTNLNMLFEEKLRDSVERNMKPQMVASSNFLNTRDIKFDNLMKNSISCYTKEASPVCEKAVVKVDVGTQTAYYNNSMEYDVHSFAQIFETPKNLYAEKPVVATNIVPSSGDTRFSPYCAPSSTPIKILKSGEIFSVAKNFINNQINEKNSFNYDFTETHKINRDEFDNPIFNKNRVFSINKKRFYKSISPKVARNAYIKLCNKKNVENVVPKRSPKSEYVIPKSFSPIKRCSVERNSSSSILNFVNTSSSSSLISRFRSFHKKHSSKWADKIIEVCSWFGISIKMGLLAMYNKTKSDATLSQCTCDDYKSKLDEICKKMSELDEAHQREVSVLNKEVAELRMEVKDLSQLRQELEAIKVALANTPRPSLCADHTPKPPPPPPPFISMAAAPPPPPPPPPIPPPMPLCTSTPISRGIKINRNAAKEDKGDKENGRPVISLDDILKVKLRKAGDRGQTPKLQRRSTQPVISMDMLKQVKLRPASRPSTPTFAELSLPSTGISSPLPTSPASSLVKMLNKVDTNSCRVKRLKRVGAYSSDDLSRRMHQFRTREHGGLA